METYVFDGGAYIVVPPGTPAEVAEMVDRYGPPVEIRPTEFLCSACGLQECDCVFGGEG